MKRNSTTATRIGRAVVLSQNELLHLVEQNVLRIGVAAVGLILSVNLSVSLRTISGDQMVGEKSNWLVLFSSGCLAVGRTCRSIVTCVNP